MGKYFSGFDDLSPILPNYMSCFSVFIYIFYGNRSSGLKAEYCMSSSKVFSSTVQSIAVELIVAHEWDLTSRLLCGT